MKKIIFLLCVAILVGTIITGHGLIPSYAEAAGESEKTDDMTKGGKDTGLFPNPSKISTIEELLEAIINFVYAMSFPIVTGVVLYAAFVMMTSQGKPEQFNRGITIIIYAAIGFLVVLLSKGIVFIIQSIFGA